MNKPIRFQIIVNPFDDKHAAFHCDLECTEADIQAIDAKHGLDDFIEKFIKPAMDLILTQFQQPYSGIDDLMAKTRNGPLPRSVEFYRQNMEIYCSKRDAMHLKRKVAE